MAACRRPRPGRRRPRRPRGRGCGGSTCGGPTPWLSSCWLWHPEVIEELWWLRVAHADAYDPETRLVAAGRGLARAPPPRRRPPGPRRAGQVRAEPARPVQRPPGRGHPTRTARAGPPRRRGRRRLGRRGRARRRARRRTRAHPGAAGRGRRLPAARSTGAADDRRTGRPPRVCSVADCGRRHYGRGYCRTHWTRWHRHGDPCAARRQRLCGIEGCGRRHSGRGLCAAHLARLRATGGANPGEPIGSRRASGESYGVFISGCAPNVVPRAPRPAPSAAHQPGAGRMTAPIPTSGTTRTATCATASTWTAIGRGACSCHRRATRSHGAVRPPAPRCAPTRSRSDGAWLRRAGRAKGDTTDTATATPTCPACSASGTCAPTSRSQHKRTHGKVVVLVGARATPRRDAVRPRDQACTDCGAPARSWSYDGADPDERTSPRATATASISTTTSRDASPVTAAPPRHDSPRGRAPPCVDVEQAAWLYERGVSAAGIGALLGVTHRRLHRLASTRRHHPPPRQPRTAGPRARAPRSSAINDVDQKPLLPTYDQASTQRHDRPTVSRPREGGERPAREPAVRHLRLDGPVTRCSVLCGGFRGDRLAARGRGACWPRSRRRCSPSAGTRVG